MAVFILETDYPSETDNPSSTSVKIDGKQKDKVRRIVHPKLSLNFAWTIRLTLSIRFYICWIIRA